jgi:hypothetical protein
VFSYFYASQKAGGAVLLLLLHITSTSAVHSPATCQMRAGKYSCTHVSQHGKRKRVAWPTCSAVPALLVNAVTW